MYCCIFLWWYLHIFTTVLFDVLLFSLFVVCLIIVEVVDNHCFAEAGIFSILLILFYLEYKENGYLFACFICVYILAYPCKSIGSFSIFVHQLWHRIWDRLLIISHELEILYTQNVHRQIALNVNFSEVFYMHWDIQKKFKNIYLQKTYNFFLLYWDLNSGSTSWASPPTLFNVGWICLR
jgi:hypothetical protein